MIDKETLKKILEFAILAPSGENSQPWKFSINEDSVDIYNLPERDLSAYNYRQLGSYLSHGALLENILITAPVFGYNVEHEIFPDKEDENLVLRLRFKSQTPKEDELFPYISKRETNRKPYEIDKLSEVQKEKLILSAKEIGFGEVKIIQDNHLIEKIANAVSANEILLIEDKNIHDFFFSHIRWNEKENLENPYGFYVKNLELAPPQIIGMRVFRFWTVAKILNNLLKISQFVAQDNIKTYKLSGAVGAVVVRDDSEESFVKAGRIVQRVWLKATQMNLNFQPLVGSIYLAYNYIYNNKKEFSDYHGNLLKKCYEDVINIFGIDSGFPAMIFRLGKGEKASARSPRFPIEQFISQ